MLNEKQSRATGNRINVNTDSEKLPVFIERKLVLENIPVRLPVSSERTCGSRAGLMYGGFFTRYYTPLLTFELHALLVEYI